MDATMENTGREDLRKIRRRQQDHLRVQPQALLTGHRRLVKVDHRQTDEVQRESEQALIGGKCLEIDLGERMVIGLACCLHDKACWWRSVGFYTTSLRRGVEQLQFPSLA